MEDLITIFQNVKKEFCDLWNYKERGETLEIITPDATTSNKFVSVFLTIKNKEFIVSDGGWLANGIYETTPDIEDDIFSKVFDYYINFFEIKNVNANGLDYYYKKTDKKVLIPNLVFDLSNFISAIANNSQIQYSDVRESEERIRFQKEANEYLKDIFPNRERQAPSVKFRMPIHESLGTIKFSAIVTNKNKLTLINYVTGSTSDYFTASIAKANIFFETINSSTLKSNVKNKVALINDTARGYNKTKLAALLVQLENTTKHNNIPWYQKERLSHII